MPDVKEQHEVRHLRVRRDGAVVTVTINRPQRRNALHPAAHAELAAAFDAYAADEQARVLVLTGAGERAFCVGSDLKERARSGVDEMPATGFGGLTERFDLDKPVIAAVNGDAIGGGLELVLACDLAIAVRHARFGLPEPRVGLAAHGGLHRLARQIPLKQAMEIALTGRLLSAEEALDGLLNAVVDAAELAAEVARWTGALLAAAPLALRATKQMMLGGSPAAPSKPPSPAPTPPTRRCWPAKTPARACRRSSTSAPPFGAAADPRRNGLTAGEDGLGLTRRREPPGATLPAGARPPPRGPMARGRQVSCPRLGRRRWPYEWRHLP